MTDASHNMENKYWTIYCTKCHEHAEIPENKLFVKNELGLTTINRYLEKASAIREVLTLPDIVFKDFELIHYIYFIADHFDHVGSGASLKAIDRKE